MISNFVSRFSSLSPSRSRSSSISTSSSSGRNSQLQTNANNIVSNNLSNRSKSTSSKAACLSNASSPSCSSTSSSGSNNVTSKIKKRDLKKKYQLVQKLTDKKNHLDDEYQKAVLQSNFLANINYFENLKLKEHIQQEQQNMHQMSPEHENATAQSLYHTNNHTSPTVLASNAKKFAITKPTFEEQIEINKFSHTRPPQSPLSVGRFADEPEYRMNHARRGYALIINNKVFDQKLEMGIREGTDRDAASLESTLIKLGFEIKLFHNLTAASMRDVLLKFSKIDHSNKDCFMCVMMSHGDNGIIYGTDQEIEIDQLIHPFKYNPTLAGKPKIFFIQACRGTTLMEGIDSNPFDIQYCSKIPLEADFLIGYSTIAGYYSWRNSANGSWFIQSLCNVLNESGRKLEIMQLLTAVNRKVAYHFESNTNEPSMHGKKQIPCIVSMLTKELYFKPKQCYLPFSNNY